MRTIPSGSRRDLKHMGLAQVAEANATPKFKGEPEPWRKPKHARDTDARTLFAWPGTSAEFAPVTWAAVMQIERNAKETGKVREAMRPANHPATDSLHAEQNASNEGKT